MSKLSNCLRGAAVVVLGLAGLVVIGGASEAAPGDVTTFAGTGSVGQQNATGVLASFNKPQDLVVDSFGNVFVADTSNNAIRKITPAGVVTTFAGSTTGVFGYAEGQGIASLFNAPSSLAIDKSNNLFVVDKINNVIRKITPGGLASTYAGSGAFATVNGTGVGASFSQPKGIAIDPFGNLYVSETQIVRKIAPGGIVTSFAGSGVNASSDGQGAAASFSAPNRMVSDSVGNLFVVEGGTGKIKKITQGGLVSSFVGSGIDGSADGQGAAASFYQPQGMAVSSSGDIYVGDSNQLIRKITLGGFVSTIAGTGIAGSSNGGAFSASFFYPAGLGFDAAGNLYVAEVLNHSIRKIESAALITGGSSSSTTTTSQGCVSGATVCPSSTTTTLPCPSTSTTIDAAGVPLCLPAATTTTIPDVTTTTTTALPCPSPSTTIDAAGVPRCLPTTTITTTTMPAAVTTTRLVPSTSMVFPSIPTPTVPGPSVPPTLLTLGAVPVVAPTQPAPTLTVAALIQQSSIPVAPVPGPSVEGQVADITPAYTGSSSISTLVAAMLSSALGTLLLASREIRATSHRTHEDNQ